ncbi:MULTISPECIES: low molecular weight protein-tyrosine-phosphatase [Spiribacter]|uniref:protein-tyrosine-phosphatase n=1 Tax=Spiribacter aquaticus TaxID=1935996 RepID=A0A557RJ27_9GAMM|nr:MULTISPECIES: low molecular weight protein-tyrosine-phosphatase [Spiribacter]KAF0280305.1 phosphotyrosine protein phosphatase [Spiribacter roseus]KAF0283288.1 phosphotyrosine protein phosphatase [Spiribacter roseus]TVO65160.1 low molecular weight phosphotyrosine protein phosphatase [Spiribacter aquaticus]
MTRLLFVCMGNICRSPIAEGIVRERLRTRGLAAHISTDSAGTHDYHVGRAPDRRAQRLMAGEGIDISDLRARQVDGFDFEFFDHILAMDEGNYAWLRAEAPSAHRDKIQPMLSHAAAPGVDWVPDPYYGGDSGFRRVHSLIDDAANGLIDAIAARPADD